MDGILVDSSVWISHFREGEPELVRLLGLDRALVHPLVFGEIACGTPPDRAQTLRNMGNLPQPMTATMQDALYLLESAKLYGRGIGLVDLLLLASAKISGVQIWTRDKRLERIAAQMQLDYHPPGVH